MGGAWCSIQLSLTDGLRVGQTRGSFDATVKPERPASLFRTLVGMSNIVSRYDTSFPAVYKPGQ